MVDVRPMLAGDEIGAEEAWEGAFGVVLEEHNLPNAPRTAEFIELGQRRMRYLRDTDPEGSWVGEDGGRIIAVAQAHIRGGIWVLATLGVLPEYQEQGIGRALLDRTLAYGDPAAPGAIFSSPDPRAMHRYISAGFDMHPAAVAYGPVRKEVTPPATVREGGAGDLGIVNEIDLVVRRADRGTDVEWLLSVGNSLLLHDSGGYAVTRGGRVLMLAALSEEAASELLLSTFSRCPAGEPADVSWILSEQQWAIRTANGAGVPLRIHESVMTRGPWQPALPYLASGLFG
jgi:GNAT superfamily N-acetyltransferase